MKATGIIRRVDDLGRIVIPREIRRALGIKEGDPLEIFVDPDENCVCLTPYMPYREPWRLLEDVGDELRENGDYREFAGEVYALAKKMRNAIQK